MDILVVDDNNDYRNTLVRYFSSKGFRVEGATDGEDALSRYRKRSHRVILLDLLMPRMGGDEMLYELSTWDTMPIVIVMTVSSRRDQSLYQLYENGCLHYEEKPIDIVETEWKIRNLIQMQRYSGQKMPGKASHMDRNMNKIYNVILENLHDERLTLKTVAQKLGIGRRKLDELLTDSLTITPRDVIRNLRLLKAREICLSGEVSTVKGLAERVGYVDAGHFSRLYHDAFNVSAAREVKRSARMSLMD